MLHNSDTTKCFRASFYQRNNFTFYNVVALNLVSLTKECQVTLLQQIYTEISILRKFII